MQHRPSFKRLLVPLDGSKLGEASLPYVEELATIAQAEVILLNVVRPQYDVALAESYSSHLAQISKEYLAHASAAANEYLASIKESLTKRGITTHAVVDVGSPAERIISCAREKHADLIVLSTHEHPGVGQRLLGSVTYKLLHYTDRPVFLVTSSAKSTTHTEI